MSAPLDALHSSPYLENGLAPSCGPNDATWTESVNNPSPVLTRNGSRFVFDPPRGLTAEELDRPLRLPVDACFLFTCSYASTAPCYSTIPDSGRRRAYVVVARHDTTNVIREYDESDNTRARCMLR